MIEPQEHEKSGSDFGFRKKQKVVDRWEPMGLPGDPVCLESRSLFQSQEVAISLLGWDRVFLRVLAGNVFLSAKEGFVDRSREISVGDCAELFSFGEHSLRATSSEAKVELHLIGPRRGGVGVPAFHRQDRQEILRDIDIRLEEEGTSPDSLQAIGDQIFARSVATNSPAFMNQLFAGRTPEAQIALRWSNELRTTLATREAAPVLANVETEVVRALGSCVGWSENTVEGLAVPGGSAANFMAIHCARHVAAPELNEHGLDGRKFGVFASNQSHYSLEKACAVLGIGKGNLILVRSDDRGKMIPEALAVALSDFRNAGGTPLLVGATAGTTVFGAFDPLEAIAEVCAREEVWFHVDAAWGGPVLFSDKAKSLVRGIERADSLTFDAHKLLGAPLTSSLFLSPHRGVLESANAVRGGAYLFHHAPTEFPPPPGDPGLLSWQCGRGLDALPLWILWKSLGRAGMGQFVDRLMELGSWFCERVRREPRLVLVAEPEYLNVCFKVLPPPGAPARDWSRHVRESLREKNQAMVNYSTARDETFLRVILVHPLLNETHLEKLIGEILEVQ